MSRAIHAVAKSIPGYAPSDSRCLPCSGVSGRAVSISPCSFQGDCKRFSQVKIMSLRCASRRVTSVCNASSSSHRRNPDFSRQNKHAFSRSRNRQNEERSGSENFDESELFTSKNGPLLPASGTPKFQAPATPGPREKEIVELFRKVQAQLRGRVSMKEEKKIRESQGKGKESETVDSLLKLLRKHSVQQGKRSNSSGGSRDFILDQTKQDSPLPEVDSNNSMKHDVQESQVPSVSRPISNFRRRSPVPRVKFQNFYSDEEPVNSVSSTNFLGKRKESSPEHELEPNIQPNLKFEPEPEPCFSDGNVFREDEISDADEVDDDAEEQNVAVEEDLSGMKLPELRALAKSKGVKRFSKLKKHELVELLTERLI